VSKQRKALIITPFGNSNFGNKLQNLAVQLSMQSRGFVAQTFVLDKKYFLGALKRLIGRLIHRLGLRGVRSSQYRAFAKFDRLINSRLIWSKRQLTKSSQAFDIAIFGSDQIWNPNHIDFAGAEYGKYLPATVRRVALSPSFGVTDLPDDRKSLFVTELKKFQAISIREFDGKNLIQKVTGADSKVLIDPTMSVDVEIWQSLASFDLVPQRSYLLICLLGHKSPIENQIKEYAANKGLEIVYLLNEDHQDYFCSGPQDFLGLISRANIVLTDSFHAVIFSLLFDTTVAILPRIGGEDMGSRFDTLREHFNYSYIPIDSLTGAKQVSISRRKFVSQLRFLKVEYNTYIDRAVKVVGEI
jgi:hypothetical protein